MRFIDWGISVLTGSVLQEWPLDTPFDLSEVYTMLAKQGLLAGYEITCRFFEIGTPAGLLETETFLKTSKIASASYRTSDRYR